jgi:hypothetical protein
MGAIILSLLGLLMLRLFPQPFARLEAALVKRFGLSAPPPALPPAPTDPLIIMGDADLSWQTFPDGTDAWAFGMSLTLDPGKGNGLLVIGAKCHAQISAPRGSSDGPLLIALCNAHKNDGPSMPTVRVDDDAATLTFVCRHHSPPWGLPLPTKLLVRFTLTGTDRIISLPPVILVQPAADKPRWVGHEAATKAEIAEFGQ